MTATGVLERKVGDDRVVDDWIVDDVTRREFVAGAVAVTFLAACGDDGGGGPASTDASSAVIVAHKYGETIIRTQPQRIVAVGPTDEDAILALGLVPVGFMDWWGNYQAGNPWPWAQPYLDAAGTAPTIIPLDGNPHFEKVAALKPDLIIGQYCGMTPEEYNTFSEIAPTVAQSGDYDDWQTPWQTMTRTIATAVGQADNGDRLIAAVDDAFARAKQSNPAFSGTSVLYVERGDGTFTVRGANEPRVQVLTNMGLVVPAEYTNPGPFGVEFSDERMPDIFDQVDVVVVMTDGAGKDNLLGNALFQAMQVTRAGRVVFITDEVLQASINWSSALSLPYAAEHVSASIAAVL